MRSSLRVVLVFLKQKLERRLERYHDAYAYGSADLDAAQIAVMTEKRKNSPHSGQKAEVGPIYSVAVIVDVIVIVK